MKICKQYHNLLQEILDNGVLRDDPNRIKNNTKRLQIPDAKIKVDLRDGFPVLTTKKSAWKWSISEMLWLLKGEMNIGDLWDQKITIWDKDWYNRYLIEEDYEYVPESLEKIKEDYINGDFDPAYFQLTSLYGDWWRNWSDIDIDQISNIIKELLINPLSSNLTIVGTDPAYWQEEVIKSCMHMMQFTTEPVNIKVNAPNLAMDYDTHYLDLHIDYRSHDAVAGYSFNVIQYAFLLEFISKIVKMTPRYLCINSKNIHIYDNQMESVKEILQRDPEKYDLPTLEFSANCFNRIGEMEIYYKEVNSSIIKEQFDTLLDLIDISDFKLQNYKSYPKLENQVEMLEYS